jgi:hypothetical protein
MINKPISPTLADFLRGNQKLIDQKYKAVAEYKQTVFEAVSKEFGTSDAEELVIRLAEKYHEPFKIIKKQGRKKKWTSTMEAMLAVCVDIRFDDDKPPSIDDEIQFLLNATVWSKFSQKGNQREVLGNENFRKHYDAGKKSMDYEVEMALFNSDPDAWIARMKEIVSKG